MVGYSAVSLIAAVALLTAVPRVHCYVAFSVVEFAETEFTVLEGNILMLQVSYTADGPIDVVECTGVDIQFVPTTAVAADLADTTNLEICIPAGNPATGTVTIPYYQAVENAVVDNPKTFTLILLLPAGITAPTGGSTIVTIMDNDRDPVVNLEQASYEFTENDGAVMVCAELSNIQGGSSSTFSIEATFAFTDNTATAGSDYNVLVSTAEFPTGSINGQTACATITILDDDSLDGHEIVDFSLSGVSDSSGLGNAVNLGTRTNGAITIKDNEAVTISLVASAALTLIEDGSDNLDTRLSVSISGVPSGGLERDLVVTLVSDDSADQLTDGTDYTVPNPFEVTFTSAVFFDTTVPVLGIEAVQDNSVEGDHSFDVALSSVPSDFMDAVTVNTNPVTVTISDDDVARLQYQLSAATLSVTEGMDTSVDICASIILNGVTDLAIPIQFGVEITPDPGITVENEDYSVMPSETVLEFPVEATEATPYCVTITIIDDTALEFDHSFTVELSAMSDPVGVGRAPGSPSSTVVTITDNEAMTGVTIAGSASQQENDATPQMVCATLDASILSVERAVAVTFSVTPMGGATADEYSISGTTATFTVGAVADACVTIQPVDDVPYEGDQVVTISIQGTSPSLGTSPSGTFTFTIQDPEDAVFQFQSASASGLEGDTLSLTISTASDLESGVTVTVEVVAGGTATSGPDFSLPSTTVQFAAAQTTSSVTINLDTDTMIEGDETAVIGIVDMPALYTRGAQSQSTVTIQDAEMATSLTLSGATMFAEGDAVEQTVTLDITGASLAVEVTVNLVITDITTSAQDYSVSNLQVTFPSCDPTCASLQTFAFNGISLIDDMILEGSETFTLGIDASSLSPPLVLGSSPSFTSQTIEVTETPPTVNFAQLTYTIDEGTPIDVCLVIQGVTSISPGVSASVDLNFQYSGTTGAASAADLQASPVNYAFDSSSALPLCMSVSAVNDNDFEGEETFRGALLNNSPSLVSVSMDLAAFSIFDPEDCTLSLSANANVDEDDGSLTVSVDFESMGTRVNGGFDVQLVLTGGTATFPDDFGTIAAHTIPDGSGTATINRILTIDNDDILEENEAFTISFPNVPECTRTPPLIHTVTIMDDDAGDFLVSLATADISTFDPLTFAGTGNVPGIAESGGVEAVVRLRRSDGGDVNLATTITVTLSLTDGTAEFVDDFTLSPPTRTPQVTFGPCMPCTGAELLASVSISFVDDMDLEFTHQFSITIASVEPSGVLTEGTLPLIQQIDDNEQNTVTVTFNQATYTCAEEGSSCTIAGSLENLVGAIQADFNIGIDVDTSIDPLTDNSDFIAPSPIQFTVGGASTFAFDITINDDEDFEGDHSFTISFSAGGMLGSGTIAEATVIITDLGDATIAIADSPLMINEGGTASINVQLTTLGGSVLRPIEFMLALVPDSLDTTSMSDYSLGSASASFGVMASLNDVQGLIFTATTDNILEITESFTFSLTSSNAMVDPAANTVTVDVMDENSATLMFDTDELRVTEGTDTMASIPLRIVSVPTGGVEGVIEVPLTILSGGATNGQDYSAVEEVARFGADNELLTQAELEGTLTDPASISIIDDNHLECEEGINVFLMPDARFATPTGTSDMLSVIIVDDEVATVSFDPAEYSGVEGDPPLSVCVTITTTALTSQCDVIAVLSAVDGAKTVEGSDYNIPLPFQVSFGESSPGPINGMTECVDISIVDDMVFEGDEQTFSVNIAEVMYPSEPSDNLMCATDCMAAITLEDNAADMVTVALNTSSSPLSGTEGDSINVCVSVTEDAPGGRECPIEVTLCTVSSGDKPANSSDYDINAMIEIPVDMSEGCTSVSLVDDMVVEGTQSFSVFIKSVSPSANFDSSDQLEIQIMDNDFIGVGFGDDASVSVMERDDATSDICVLVTSLPSGGVECPFYIFIEPTADITALLGEDYESVVIHVLVPAMVSDGQQLCAMDAPLGILDDDIVEDDQSFEMSIVGASLPNAVDSDDTNLTVVIMDDSDALKVELVEQEYIVPEGQSAMICVGSIGQIQRSIELSLSHESLTNILRGEPRASESLDSITLGATAAFDNTITDPMECVNIPNNEDGMKEGVQLSILRLSTADSGVCVGRDQSLVIEEANGIVTASLSVAATVNEGDGYVEVCVSLSQPPVQDIVSISVTTTEISAEENSDYTPIDALLEWHQDSELEQCVKVPIINDECVEEKEEFFNVSLSTEDECVVFSSSFSTVGILDDDRLLLDFRAPFLRVEESQGNVTLCVYVCDGELKRDASFQLSVLNGTAYSPGDFSVGGPFYELTFTPSTVDQNLCVTIPIEDDMIYEETEFFIAELSTEDSCVEFKQNRSFVDILDNDCVTLALNETVFRVEEADGVVHVCVSLEGELETSVSAMLFAVPGDASDGSDFDQGPPTMLTFSEPGEQCVSISIEMDNLLEETELFSVVLGSRDDRVKLGDRIARVYILDSDTVTFGFSQSVYMVPEEGPDGRGSMLEVCVEVFAGALDRKVVITLSDEDGSALGGLDYMEFNQVVLTRDLVFQPNPVSRRKRFLSPVQQCTTVTILPDDLVEDDEYFRLSLSTEDPRVLFAPINASVVILNNDFANVSLEMDQYDVVENVGNFTVCAVLLGGELARGVAVNISTSDAVGSATADSDYISIEDFSLTFAPSSPLGTLSCVEVFIEDDIAIEETERFDLVLSVESDPVTILPPSSAAVFIEDDDVLEVGLAANGFDVDEIDGFVRIAVEVLSGGLGSDAIILASTDSSGATATAGSDYEELSNTSVILPSGLSVGDFVFFNITIINDDVVEEMFENFTIVLGGESSVVKITGIQTAVVDIREDLTDSVNVFFDQVSSDVNEGDSSFVCVNITGELERQVSFSVSTVNGSAISGMDHDFPDTTEVIFSSSPDSHCISFTAIQDEIYEIDESFSIHLGSEDAQVVFSNVYSTVFILDDDKVELQLVTDTVCEADGTATVCVLLLTDIEREVVADLETSDLSATSSEDYNSAQFTFVFPDPSSANTEMCGNITINDDSIVEPCEVFHLNLTSSAERSCIVDDGLPDWVLINDDEDVTGFSLFNNSPQIVGNDINVDYTITGCALVLCEVLARTDQIDCSPPPGSLTGNYFMESVTGRRNLQQLAITIEPLCPNKAVPTFETRPFRIDSVQCSVVFTDQRFEFDSASGDTTFEWSGTGPTAELNVNLFTCSVDGGLFVPCSSPYTVSGLASGEHSLTVLPGVFSGCDRRIRQTLMFNLP